MLRFGCLFLASCLLSACAHVHQLYNQGLAASGATGLVPNHSVNRNGNWVLGQDTSFYIALSGLSDVDATFLNLREETSNVDEDRAFVEDQVADLLVSEISRQFPRVMRASATESLFDARNSALGNRIDFVLYPRVYLWEDTIGTWTEMANALRYRRAERMDDAFGLDRARLQLTLMDATSGRILDVVSIDTRAGLLGLYEQTPERLLLAAVGQYVNALVP